MSLSSAHIKVADVITTHQNADFDAFAATVGASLLFPEARIVFAGSLNRNVREFAALHGEHLPTVGIRSLDFDSVRRLIMVDTADCARLAELAPLCGRPGVEVIVFDHHQEEAPERPSFVEGENWVLSPDGAQATSMVHILREREVPISPLEATIFALGIHEDTGSLTYPRTTVRDAEMLALCMRLGASQTLDRILPAQSTHAGAERDPVAHGGRSEGGTGAGDGDPRRDDVQPGVRRRAQRHRPQGHGPVEFGRTPPGSGDGGAGVRDREVAVYRRRCGAPPWPRWEVAGTLRLRPRFFAIPRPSRFCVCLLDELAATAPTLPTAGDIMSRPVRFIDVETSVEDALLAAQRYGHSGISVKEGDKVVGIVARRDLDKAVRHGLGHAPVKGVMTRNVMFAPASATVEELRRLMASTNVGRLPILTDAAYEDARRSGVVDVSTVVGIATRTDVLAALQAGGVGESESDEAVVCTIPSLSDLPAFGTLFRAISALSEDFSGVYLVGGFVRDLLLGKPNADVDIAVDGDGVEFARRLAARMGGRVRVHQEFQTAVVLISPDAVGEGEAPIPIGPEPFHVDVATTRTEFYDYPAALPSVEHASIRQDLFRRDFSINAMAVALKGEEFGEVLDFFGGLKDLHEGVIRVLHNLSFIEDPTRIFRAVRYENRYGFRMDEQTRSLARACVEMRLVGDLSSARLRDELVALLGEADVDWTLGRLYELGVARQVHPKLATGERTMELIHSAGRPRRGVRSRRRRGHLATAARGDHTQYVPRGALHLAGETEAQTRRPPSRARQCDTRSAPRGAAWPNKTWGIGISSAFCTRCLWSRWSSPSAALLPVWGATASAATWASSGAGLWRSWAPTSSDWAYLKGRR